MSLAVKRLPSSWCRHTGHLKLQPGQPCGGERLLLMFDRWRKLGKAFYSEKRGEFDISKARAALVRRAFMRCV